MSCQRVFLVRRATWRSFSLREPGSIPARKPGGLGTQAGREHERRRHQEEEQAEQNSVNKAYLDQIRWQDKTNGGRRNQSEMELGEKTEIYMVSEGRRVDWGDQATMEEEKVVDVNLMMEGGGKKKKRVKNPWDSSRSRKARQTSLGKKVWEKKLARRCWMMC